MKQYKNLYVAEIDFFVPADNQAEALKEIKEITNYLCKKYDNRAKLQKLTQQFSSTEFKDLKL